MNNMNLDWLNYTKIVEIVEIASQIILQIYLNDELFMNMNLTIQKKDVDNSPLTIADKKANDFICQELKGLYPDIPIISEENKNDDWEIRKKYTWVWLVDPLDGTKEFIKRNGDFTVNIGLVYLGQPVAGFVGVPAQGVIYWGGVGVGAWKKEISSEDKGKKPTDLLEYNLGVKKSGVIRIVASKSHMDEKTNKFIHDNYISKGIEVDLLNIGSSIKILWIAENKADIYPRLAPTMEWDTCAAHAILKACGGKLEAVGKSHFNNPNSCKTDNYDSLEVCPFFKEAELSYNKINLLNPNFIGRLKTQFERKHQNGHLAE